MEHLIKFSLLCDQLTQNEFETFRNTLFADKRYFCKLLFEHHLNQLKLLPKLSKINSIVDNIIKLNDFATKIIHLRRQETNNNNNEPNHNEWGYNDGYSNNNNFAAKLDGYNGYNNTADNANTAGNHTGNIPNYTAVTNIANNTVNNTATPSLNLTNHIMGFPTIPHRLPSFLSCNIALDSILNHRTITDEEFELMRTELFSDKKALKQILSEYYLQRMYLCRSNIEIKDKVDNSISPINDYISDEFKTNTPHKFDMTAGAYVTLIAVFLDVKSLVRFELTCRRIFVYIHDCCMKLDYESTTKCYKYCTSHYSAYFFSRFKKVKILQINAQKIMQNNGYNLIRFYALLPSNGGNITHLEINAKGLSSISNISLFLKVFGHFHSFKSIRSFRFITNEYIEFPLFQSSYTRFRSQLKYLQLDQFISEYHKGDYALLISNLRGLVCNSYNSLYTISAESVYLPNIYSYHHHCCNADYNDYSNVHLHHLYNQLSDEYNGAATSNKKKIILNPRLKEFCCTFPSSLKAFNYEQWECLQKFHFVALQPVVFSEKSSYWYNFIELVSKPTLEYISVHCQIGLFRVLFDAFGHMLRYNKKVRPKLKFKIDIDCSIRNKETVIYLNNVLVKNLFLNMHQLARDFMFIITINDAATTCMQYVPLIPWKKPIFKISSIYARSYNIKQTTNPNQTKLIVSTYNYPNGYEETWLMSCDKCANKSKDEITNTANI